MLSERPFRRTQYIYSSSFSPVPTASTVQSTGVRWICVRCPAPQGRVHKRVIARSRARLIILASQTMQHLEPVYTRMHRWGQAEACHPRCSLITDVGSAFALFRRHTKGQR